MTIRTRVTLYAGNGNSEGVIRVGTVGVEHKRIVRFYDVSGIYFAAFSRQDCLEQKEMFECRPDNNDREISVMDVLKVIERHKDEIPQELGARIVSEIIGL